LSGMSEKRENVLSPDTGATPARGPGAGADSLAQVKGKEVWDVYISHAYMCTDCGHDEICLVRLAKGIYPVFYVPIACPKCDMGNRRAYEIATEIIAGNVRDEDQRRELSEKLAELLQIQ
jgi:hypothetical protein